MTAAARALALCTLPALACVGALAGPASAAEGSAPRPRVEVAPADDDHPSLLELRRRTAHDVAVRGVLDGSITALPGETVVALPGRSQPLLTGTPTTSAYTEIATTGTDRVLTILVDFGTGDFAGRTWNGPAHGRLTDAAGQQTPYYASVERFEQLLFGPERSLRDYVDVQSGGRYGVGGAVHGWVTVPHNAAYYGVDWCAGTDCPDRVARFVADAMDAFVGDFYAHDPAGDLAAHLAPYDRRDRYDADLDGEFDEPDGYIDRLVLVFAGQGQEDSGEADALHSRYGSVSGDNLDLIDTASPPALPRAAADVIGAESGSGPLGDVRGGHPVGGSGLWVDTFLAVPEDVGLGKLFHLFGHDLGLVHLGDPAATIDVDANVRFWSPMAAGGRLGYVGHAGPDQLDAAPPNLLAAERLLLGWLAPEVVRPTDDRTVELTDGVAAVVPLGALGATTTLSAPATGARAFVTTAGSSAEAVLQRPLAGEEGRVTWRQWTDVEPLFDTLRVQALTAAGWRDIAPVSTGRWGWTSRSAPLPEGASSVRFVYATDLVATGRGVLIDDIAVGSEPTEGGEGGLPAGWTATGWEVGDGTVQAAGPGYYLAERRAHVGYDAALEYAPYVADPRSGTDATDHFAYEDGVLVTFWDGRVADNAVTAHPGSGRLLVVDARPAPVQTVSGAEAPLGIGPFDAAFGTAWTHGFTVDTYALTPGGAIAADQVRVRAQPPAPTFDDREGRFASGGKGQLQLPGAGVTMTVVAEHETTTAVRFGAPPAGPSATVPVEPASAASTPPAT